MPLQALKQKHLASSEHAAPSGVTCVRRLAKRPFKLATVSEPSDGGVGVIQICCHFLQVLLVLLFFDGHRSRRKDTFIA